MKILIIPTLLLISLSCFSQSDFDSFGKKDENGPKLVWSSYVESQRTWSISFYDNGSIYYQNPEYDYIVDNNYNQTFQSLSEVKKMHSDMLTVLKNSEPIIKENYAIQKGPFSSVELKIKDIPKTYAFTKYALKVFGKELYKY